MPRALALVCAAPALWAAILGAGGMIPAGDGEDNALGVALAVQLGLFAVASALGRVAALRRSPTGDRMRLRGPRGLALGLMVAALPALCATSAALVFVGLFGMAVPPARLALAEAAGARSVAEAAIAATQAALDADADAAALAPQRAQRMREWRRACAFSADAQSLTADAAIERGRRCLSLADAPAAAGAEAAALERAARRTGPHASQALRAQAALERGDAAAIACALLAVAICLLPVVLAWLTARPSVASLSRDGWSA